MNVFNMKSSLFLELRKELMGKNSMWEYCSSLVSCIVTNGNH